MVLLSFPSEKPTQRHSGNEEQRQDFGWAENNARSHSWTTRTGSVGSPHGISGHRAHTQCEVSQEPAASLGPGSQKPWVRCQLGQSRGRRLQFTASQAELGTGNLGALFEQTWWIGSPWLLQTGQSPFDSPSPITRSNDFSRDWGALGDARPGQSSLSAGAVRVTRESRRNS